MSQSEACYWAEWYRPFAAGTKAAITTALRRYYEPEQLARSQGPQALSEGATL
jgi:hypothetical protein